MCILMTHMDILVFGYSKVQNVRQNPTWCAVEHQYSQQRMRNTLVFCGSRRIKSSRMLSLTHIEGKYISRALCQTYWVKSELGQGEVLFHLGKQVSCVMEIAASHFKLLTFSKDSCILQR